MQEDHGKSGEPRKTSTRSHVRGLLGWEIEAASGKTRREGDRESQAFIGPVACVCKRTDTRATLLPPGLLEMTCLIVRSLEGWL